MTAAGRTLAGSWVAIARSEVVIAIAHGALRPHVCDQGALRNTVRGARKIGLSTGPSGVALRQLFAGWDVASDCLVQAPPGVPVASLLARGNVEIGFQQRSELIGVEGVDVLSAMPPGLEIVTTFCGAVCTASAQPEAASALLEFVGSPIAEAARRRHGFIAAQRKTP